ncbi:MAG: N-acetylmuramoyl-L-alanine amidase [Deltaproteobacteria bacterium]|nr:MAG: N-acetylmuramoyl-L-alanine amidase [Deltaproteobacteria bacterium]
MKERLCLALAALGLVIGAHAAAESERFDTVVIDPGHGGEDRGAQGPGGLNEKEVVLAVARRLGARLQAAGLDVVLTRNSDRTLSLEQRTSIANDARADLFLSIHANSAHVSSARGAEIYFVSLEATDDQAELVAQRENEAFGMLARTADGARDPLFEILADLIATEHLKESNEFARLAEKALANGSGSPSRGVKQAPFVVLMGVQMPASLIEIGFLSNASEERTLRSEAQRDRIAAAIAAAVLEFGRRFDARRGVSDEQSIVRRGG